MFDQLFQHIDERTQVWRRAEKEALDRLTPAQRNAVAAARRRILASRFTRGLRQEIAARLFPMLGIPCLVSELRLQVTRNDGTVEDFGVVSRRVVTNVGVNFIAAAFLGTANLNNMNFHDSGTGTNAESVNDTTLQTPTGGARSTGVQTSPGTGQYQSIATITYSGGFAITEWGIFSASSVGTLLDRFVFAAIDVVSGNAIQATFLLTFSAGG
jgi:hypothetical protein